MNYQSIISIYARAISITEMARSLRRSGMSCNEVWRLKNPLAWHMANTAANIARVEMQAEPNLDNLETSKLRLASLRHFTRELEGACEVSIGSIENALKLNVDIDVAGIKRQVRELVAVRLLNKPMRVDQIVKLRVEMESAKLEEAAENARINKTIVDNVFYLCNSNGIELHGKEVMDEKAVDWDQYGYVLEGLIERLEIPLTAVRNHANRIIASSCITETQNKAVALLKETEKVMVEAGFDLAKLDAKVLRHEKLMEEADAEMAESEGCVEDALAAADKAMPDIQAPDVSSSTSPQRYRVPAAVQDRQKEETAVKLEAKQHETKVAAAALKAKATKAAKAKAEA